MADWIIKGDWRCCGPHDTEWHGICECPCHLLRTAERYIAGLEAELRRIYAAGGEACSCDLGYGVLCGHEGRLREALERARARQQETETEKGCVDCADTSPHHRGELHAHGKTDACGCRPNLT